MLMLLLPAKFMSVGRNRGKIAKQKLIILPSAGFFAKPFVKRILCFCFFGTKNPFSKLFRAKTQIAVNS